MSPTMTVELGAIWLIGASLTFRWQFLCRKEETERAYDRYAQGIAELSEKREREYESSKLHGSLNDWELQDRVFSLALAAIWPIPVLFFWWGKILFPKGAVTKYAAQKARIAELEAREAEHVKYLKILQESGQSTQLIELAVENVIEDTRQRATQLRDETR